MRVARGENRVPPPRGLRPLYPRSLLHFERDTHALGRNATLCTGRQIHVESLADIISREVFNRRRNDEPKVSADPCVLRYEGPYAFGVGERHVAIDRRAALFRRLHADQAERQRVIHWLVERHAQPVTRTCLWHRDAPA